MIATLTVVVPTRSAAIDAAKHLGASGHAADLIADRRGAREGRNVARVQVAAALGLTWAVDALGGLPGDDVIIEPRPYWLDDSTHEQTALAWALLASDAYGIGSPGYWGRSARVWPLSTLGTGRRHAGDGSAWTAAIASAASSLSCGGCWQFVAAGGHLMVASYGHEDVCCDCLPLYAREAVVGTELLAATDRRDRDAVTAWAAVYNAVREEQVTILRELIRQDQLAADAPTGAGRR
jgi:hypothetical protein